MGGLCNMPYNKDGDVNDFMSKQIIENRKKKESEALAELPKYVCHKEVHALKIDAIHLDVDAALVENRETDGSAFIYPEDKRYSPFTVDAQYVRKHNPVSGGYYVVYADGYKSFSPAEAFEDGYTLI